MTCMNINKKRSCLRKATRTILLKTGEVSLLKRWVKQGRSVCQIIDRARLPILILLEDTYPEEDWSIASVESMIGSECLTANTSQVKPYDRLTSSTRVPLEGEYEIEISRRCDLKTTGLRKDVFQYLSDIPFRIHGELAEDLLRKRDTLSEWSQGRNEKAIFLADKFVTEFQTIGTETFYSPFALMCYRGRGYASRWPMHPMCCKKVRSVFCFADSYKVTAKMLNRWGNSIKHRYGYNSSTINKILASKVSKDAFLAHGGTPMVLGELMRFTEAKKTARTNHISYIDMNASGIVFQLLLAGDPKALLYADCKRKGYIHPITVFSRKLMTPGPYFIPELRNARLEEVHRQVGKPAASGGQYLAGAYTMASSVLGIDVREDVDPDDPPTMEIPDVFGNAFNSWTQEEIVAYFKKKLGRKLRGAFDSAFPSLAKLGDALTGHWQDSVGEDGKGTPPSIVMPDGYGVRNHILRRNKDRTKQVTVKYLIDSIRSDQTDTTTFPAFPMEEDLKGQGFPPNFVHAIDAIVLWLTVQKLKKAGIPVVTIHDSLGIPLGCEEIANRFFVESVNEVLQLCLLAQYDIRTGKIPVVPSGATMCSTD